MNNTTVRTLIEHLAQFDDDMLVKISHPSQSFILLDLPEDGIIVEEYVDTRVGVLESIKVVALVPARG